MIRVLHIVGGMDRAGAETMLMNLYRKLDRDEFQFDFVYFKDQKCDYDDEIEALGGKIYRVIASNSWARMKKITTLLKSHPEYKIVHSHTLLNSAFSLWAAQKAGVKNRIAHSHSTSKGKTSYLSKIYEYWALKRIHNLATLSVSCGNEASNYLFPYDKNVLILPNGVDIKSLISLSEENKKYLLSQFPFVTDSLKIIQVGRMEDVKNFPFTIRVAEEMKSRKINAHFFLIGQGILENQIKEMVRQKQLDDIVHILGVRSDVPQLMAGANVMIMPSLFEGFPVVLAESQAIGLKSVVSSGISSEVDLGVGLIDFVDLNIGLEVWIKALKGINDETMLDKMDRMKILQERGFDVDMNIARLQEVYKNMV